MMRRSLLQSASILVFLIFAGGSSTSYYFSSFGSMYFSMMPPECVIGRSETSLVKCALECINETSCVSIIYCRSQSREKVCLLTRNITDYNTTNDGYECQLYRVECHNGGSYNTNSLTCSCPPRTSGRFCQYIDKDCGDYLNTSGSGIYRLAISGTEFDAYCDMETDGGGWTVFQRRMDGSVDFQRTWIEYENGFGALDGEFWLGNRFIHELTSSASYRIRIDMNDEGVLAYAEYGLFRITGADDKYKLELGTYTAGNAGDSFSVLNGQRFTTKDSDNDQDVRNCAVTYHGAWWHTNCHNGNLNGEYGNVNFGKGINWKTLTGFYRSLIRVSIKIKRN